MKLCVDCGYCHTTVKLKDGDETKTHKCKRDRLSMVDGRPVENCWEIRDDETKCGKDANWFTPINKQKNLG